MRNLSIEQLAFLFADNWTMADVEAATDEELSTGVGIAMLQGIEFVNGELAHFHTVEDIVGYQRGVEQQMAAEPEYGDSDPQNSRFADEPF